MKILVVQLLRIGDLILSAPVLAEIREKFPDARIDLLVNRGCRPMADMLSGISQIHEFDREALQRGLGEVSVPVFESYARLDGLIDEINSQSYDVAINLTHNRLSGWLMGLIAAKKKLGLSLDGHGRASFGNCWFKYLNDQVDFDSREVFHYADVFRLALGFDETKVYTQFGIAETAGGRAEVERFFAENSDFASAEGLISIQALTSDTKKNWQLSSFSTVMQQLVRTYPKVGFVVLGSPSERDSLVSFVNGLKANGVLIELGIFSLAGAFSFLKKCRLLLTGDTSIKHLASAAKTRVVELSLGSSDLFRTGTFLHGSVILQPKVACSPCSHSKSCHRPSHECGLGLPQELVTAVVSEVYSGRSFQLKNLAEEYKDRVEIYLAQTRNLSLWSAVLVNEELSESNVARWLNLTVQKLRLEAIGQSDKQVSLMSSRGHQLSQRGTELRQLEGLFKSVFPGVSTIEWRHLLSDFERQATLVEGRLNSFKVGLQYLRSCYEDAKKMRDFIRGLIAFREKIRHFPLLRPFRLSLDQVIEDDISPGFTRIRKMTGLIDEIEVRTELSLRLIRGLLVTVENESELENP